MKVKELSLLIISEDQTMRQLLAALVSDRYGSVTAAPPEQAAVLMASNSFDLVLRPMLESDAEDLKQTSDAKAPTELRSGITGKRYEFWSVNPKGSSCAAHPFERVLLEVAIERAEMSVNQVKRIVKRDAIF